jgi:hypothetical protein
VTQHRLIKRPAWYRLFARRTWERKIGKAPQALVVMNDPEILADQLDHKMRRKATRHRKAMKGIAGA